MSDTVLTPPKRNRSGPYEAAAAQLLVEMNRLDERMDQLQAESEQLKAETQVIKARTGVTLSRLQDLVNRLASHT